MQTDTTLFEDDYCLTRSARRRERARRWHADKELLRMGRELDALYSERRYLPLVPLDVPKQHGYNRTFVVREDILRSYDGLFYSTLLTKINTVQWCRQPHHFYTYSGKKWRKRKRLHHHPQALRSFTEREFNSPDCPLTSAEKALFRPIPRRWRGNVWQGESIVYILKDDQAFELKIVPNIITHVKAHDSVLAARIKELGDKIGIAGPARGRYCRLLGGGYHWWSREEIYPDRYPFHKKTMPQKLALAAAEQIEQP
ncbi:hypothetical protein MKQ70_06360 [Chitinophaga sedimenti]|uniref:hypothetical protein n=1 Tax=Chitinophaga sedimenti TaxID=2033606 RepID=UPI0020063B5C|nr:hypothetical protein [Chitinophaga sedimenti]MCK7554646.1 hypothetical protein [Chitinophaga sedimenti]